MPVKTRVVAPFIFLLSIILTFIFTGAGGQSAANASPWKFSGHLQSTSDVRPPSATSGLSAKIQTGAYGGPDYDTATAIRATADGGYVAAGNTLSYGSGDAQAWVLKLDSAGNVVWQKTYGGNGTSLANAIYPTVDGGYILGGFTDAFGAGGGDAWVLKLNGSGSVVWQNTYGGSNLDAAYSVYPISDGYIVAGVTYSFGAGNADAWVLKLDDIGNITWQKTYGGSGYEAIYSLFPTADLGFIAAGYTSSSGARGADGWVLKLDRSGMVVWQKAYGTNSDDVLYSIAQTPSGGFVAAGSLISISTGDSEAYILLLDQGGNIIWQKSFGGSKNDYFRAVISSSDAIVVAGFTDSFGAGNGDAWVLKLDGSGNVVWQKTYGGSSTDEANSIAPTGTVSYIMAGYSFSYGAGDADLMALALDGGGNTDNACATTMNSAAIGVNISGISANIFLTASNSTANLILSVATVTDTTFRNTQMATSFWHQPLDSQGLVARFDTNFNSYIDIQDIMRAVAQQGRTCP